MRYYSLKTKQIIPASLEKTWEFFSNPANLSKITPPELNFVITSELPEVMYPGMIITYNVHPLLGIPVRWMTEITQVNKPFFFIDEQRVGPYKLWHHQHHFKETGNGVEMQDIIHYALPFGPLGSLVHPFIVRPKLEDIFSYRKKVINTFFPS